jgi:phosphoglycerol transferase MdoB-like AlkP superfamily enzyme
MSKSWEKPIAAFYRPIKKLKQRIQESRPILWLLKKGWFKQKPSIPAVLLTILALTAFASYAFLIRKELTVGENQGNIKFVASQSKDPQSKGYKENIRTNLTINGTGLVRDRIIQQEWKEYRTGIPVPIFTADAKKEESQTLEIQHDEPIKSLYFEYSSYPVGGILQVYLDDVLYRQINTYNDKELIYKSITLTFDQHLAITASNSIWWAQLGFFALVLLLFLKRLWTKGPPASSHFLRHALLGAGLYGLAISSLNLAFSYGETKDFFLSNTYLNPGTLPIFLVCFILLSILVKEVIPTLKRGRLAWLGQTYSILLNGLAPFLGLYLIETAYSIYSIVHLSPADFLANILILTIIWFCLALLTTSIRAASLILVSLSMVVGIVTKILLIARNMPLLSYHFLQIRDGLSVAGETDFTLTSGVFALILTCWLYIISISFLPNSQQVFDFSFISSRFSPWMTYAERFSSLQRKVIQKAVLISMGLISLLFLAKPAIYAVAKSVDLSLYFWTLQSTYYDHGLPVALTRYHIASQIQVPEGYSSAKVEQILSAYPRKEAAATTKPNIIMIQNESLTDYSQLTKLTFSPDPLQFIHSLETNTIKGKLLVSVFAGSTANTEYEVLTSNSMAILPPNSFPFQQLISSPRNSIVNYLENQNYQTYAFHPYGKDNYRRSQVYGYFGFDQSYFENSDPSFQDLIPSPKRVRGYISDQALYEGSLKLMEESDAPIINFIVTMQGHGGYTRSQADFPRTISVTNAENDASATDFLSSVDASDEAFQSLVTSLSQSDEPTIVVLFGDHQPILTDSYFKPYLDGKDPSSRYETPLLIWANFALPEMTETTISPNYITPYLLQILSQTDHALPLTSYYQFLSKVQTEIPVMTTWGYYDGNGTYSEKAPTSELYQQYKYIQYNNVVDKNSIDLTEYYQ